MNVLSLLKVMPTATCATHNEIFLYIEKNPFMGKGIGDVDILDP